MKIALIFCLMATGIVSAEQKRNFPVDGLTSGPEKGALVIDGGSGGLDGARNFRRFVELAGGEKAHIIVVPAAQATADKYKLDGMRKSFIEREGMIKPASLTLLHTADPKVADTEEFVAPIRKATGIWFTGGRQWRIVDAYGGTLAEREFRAVLERGGAIGGSSAGATIQGSFLARGDTSTNTIMLGDHQRGFAYLKNSAIDQHVVARGRQLHMIEILTDPEGRMEKGHDRKSLMGFGVDEGSAMVVIGDELEVIGPPSGSVLVYDPSIWTEDTPDEKKFIQLGPGSKYDLKTRTTLKLVAPKPKPKPAKSKK
ncbi:MAG: Type 1 glutamine amidotransferase-like domain-containing protein [Verrucomicrobiota bacterium]